MGLALLEYFNHLALLSVSPLRHQLHVLFPECTFIRSWFVLAGHCTSTLGLGFGYNLQSYFTNHSCCNLDEVQ